MILDKAAAEQKIGEGLSSDEQLLEPDEFQLTAQEPPPQSKSCAKRKALTTHRPPRPEIPFTESSRADLSAFMAAFAGTDSISGLIKSDASQTYQLALPLAPQAPIRPELPPRPQHFQLIR